MLVVLSRSNQLVQLVVEHVVLLVLVRSDAVARELVDELRTALPTVDEEFDDLLDVLQ